MSGYPRALCAILVKLKGRNNNFKYVKVRKDKVHDVLLWLIQNNPLSADAEIEMDT